MRKLILLSILLCAPSLALAQTTVWAPGTGYYLFDGGAQPPPGPLFPIMAPGGIVSATTTVAYADAGSVGTLGVGGPITQFNTATPATLVGNPAVNGVSIVLNNQLNQTSGTLLSVQNNSVQKAAIDFSGAATVASIKAGTSSVITNIATGPACSIVAGTTCTVTTVGGTAASQCFFAQTSGTAVGCECAAGTNSVIITCPAATTGTFTGLLIN